MANAELPFSNPAGDGPANRRDDEGCDRSIAAALAASHRSTAQARRHWYLAASARFLRGTGGAILGLTLLAFGGGLFLAHVSVSGPEHEITIGSFAPEVIYKRPATAENAPVADRDGAHTAQPAESIATSGARAAQISEEVGTRVSRQDFAAEAQQIIRTSSVAQNALPEATANFAAAMRLNAIGGAQNGGSGPEITSGFAAEELPSVPEPAAGSTIAISLATLLGLQQFVRRRRNIQ